MPVRSEMRAAIWPSTSSSLPPPSSSRGTSGPSGQLGQVSSAVWISRWMCVKSFTLTTSWALSDSKMRRWVSCAAFMASSWLRTDSPFASSRELSSSRIYTKHTSTNQSETAASTHWCPLITPTASSIYQLHLSLYPPYPLSRLVVFDSLTRVKGNVEMISCASQNAPSALAQLTIHPEREGGSRWRRKPDPSSMLGLIRLIDAFPSFFLCIHVQYISVFFLLVTICYVCVDLVGGDIKKKPTNKNARSVDHVNNSKWRKLE